MLHFKSAVSRNLDLKVLDWILGCDNEALKIHDFELLQLKEHASYKVKESTMS